MSENILETILAEKRSEIIAQAAAVPLSDLKAMSSELGPCRGFAKRLRETNFPPVIAEIKRASPSKGPIRPDLDPLQTAKDFFSSGAACLSVLTDRKFFQGDLAFLENIRAGVPEIPLLRKDFICHPYQVWQSRASGADALLLIVAAIPPEDLELLCQEARNAGLDVLLEAHTVEELSDAVKLLERSFPEDESIILGINNRDLRSFSVDLSITKRLVDWLRTNSAFKPRGLIVAESGISRGADILQLASYGAQAFLIGESLVAEGAPGENLKRMIGAAKKKAE